MILMRPGIDLTLTHGSVPISGPDKECVCILYNPLGTKSPYKDPLNHAQKHTKSHKMKKKTIFPLFFIHTK